MVYLKIQVDVMSHPGRAGGSRQTRLALKFDSQIVSNLGQPTTPTPYALAVAKYFVVAANVGSLDKHLSC